MGSSGIGAGLAEAFAERGAIVGIVARREDRLAEVLGRCRVHTPDSKMWVVDLADPEAVDRLSADVVAELGGVEVLVNNAGIPKRRHVTALDMATVESVMAINYLSPVRLTLALLPQMIARGSGRIVNIASVAAPLSSPGESAYDASKAAIAVFSEAMAVDLWDTGVSITVVYPGVVDTELFTLPDNDPFTGDVEAITVDDAVEPSSTVSIRLPRRLRTRLLRRVRPDQGARPGRIPGRDGRLREDDVGRVAGRLTTRSRWGWMGLGVGPTRTPVTDHPPWPADHGRATAPLRGDPTGVSPCAGRPSHSPGTGCIRSWPP